MSEYSSPHTNSARLGNYIGKTVRLWAKVHKLQGETAIVQASDGGEVKIKIPRGATFSHHFVEVLGKVEEANVMAMLTCTDLGSDFTDTDLALYNRVVDASESSKFRHLFQSSA